MVSVDEIGGLPERGGERLQLRLDLGSHLADHHRERPISQHVRLQLINQRRLDLFLALVDGHWTDRVAAVAMACASISCDALLATSERAHALRDDRTAAVAFVQWNHAGKLP